MNESDKEYYDKYFAVKKILEEAGWISGKQTRGRDTISSIMSKDGFAIHLLYGCEDTIKNELL